MKPFWRRRLLVPSLVLLGLNVAVYAAFTFPRTIRERTLTARAAALRQEVSREKLRTEALRRRAETMSLNTTDVQRFYGQSLGGKATLLEVQEELAALGRELGIRTGGRNYSTEKIRGSDSIRRFRMTMKVRGAYSQIVSYLDRLERSPHFLTVDEVRLGRREGGETELDIVLSAYFREKPTGTSS